MRWRGSARWLVERPGVVSAVGTAPAVCKRTIDKPTAMVGHWLRRSFARGDHDESFSSTKRTGSNATFFSRPPAVFAPSSSASMAISSGHNLRACASASRSTRRRRRCLLASSSASGRGMSGHSDEQRVTHDQSFFRRWRWRPWFVHAAMMIARPSLPRAADWGRDGPGWIKCHPCLVSHVLNPTP